MAAQEQQIRNLTFHIFAVPNLRTTSYRCDFCQRTILPHSIVLATKRERSLALGVNHWDCEKYHLPEAFIEARRLGKYDIDLRDPAIANRVRVEVNQANANPLPRPAPAAEAEEEQPADIPQELHPFQERYFEWYRQHINRIRERNATALEEREFIGDHLQNIFFDEEDTRNLDIIATLRGMVIATPLRPNGTMAISLENRINEFNVLNTPRVVADITPARRERLYAIEDALTLRQMSTVNIRETVEREIQRVNERNNAEAQNNGENQSNDESE